MKFHPRVLPVQAATADMRAAVVEVISKHHDLTHLELIGILNEIQASWIKYVIRDERHPDDPEKRGGEE
jgi:hypothetical protein